ncbi:hypothetical protein D3C78_17680 [compost metagenome]
MIIINRSPNRRLEYDEQSGILHVPIDMVDLESMVASAYEIISNTDQEVIVRNYSIGFIKDNGEHITSNFIEQTKFTFDETGKQTSKSRGNVPAPLWWNRMKELHDLVQHPYNNSAHFILSDTAPLYKTKSIWICADKVIYIRTMGVWLSLPERFKQQMINNIDPTIREEIKMAMNFVKGVS